MCYNTKNFTAQNGEETVISGALGIVNGGMLVIDENSSLVIEEGATVEGLATEIPAATVDSIGGVYQVPVVLDSSASTVAELVEDFNALLDTFREAGIINTAK